MTELPLFPLNTVLFPGVPIFLHVFEERYKQMVRLCVNQRRPFGVVLIRRGQEAFGQAEPHSVACSADIVQVQPLHDREGRLNIVAVGRERVRIESYHTNQPYMMGEVEPFPLPEGGAAATLQASRQALAPWLEEYMSIFARMQRIKFDKSQLPDDPIAFAFLAAHLLQVPPGHKQAFLMAPTGLELLNQLRKTYRLEVALLRTVWERAQASPPNGVEERPFSLN